MAAKTLYLVRHGETADNRRSIHQPITVSLNARGRKQAEAVAHALADVKVDALLTSDAIRAQETAAIIAARTQTTPRSNALLRELHRGTLVEGTRHLGWRSIVASVRLFFHAHDSHWRGDDGENLMDFRQRIEEILTLLANETGENMIVVTHRGVINGMCYGIRHGFSGSIRAFVFGALFGKTRNCSITKLSYDPSRKALWQVAYKNDTRHLADL